MHHNETNYKLNPLIENHLVDTLAQVKATLVFIQEFVAKTIEQPDTTSQPILTNAGLHAILKTINSAVDYEIERLENYQPLTLVK